MRSALFLILTTAVWGSLPSIAAASQEAGELLDERLIDSEAFGRYADHSRRRQGSVVVYGRAQHRRPSRFLPAFTPVAKPARRDPTQVPPPSPQAPSPPSFPPPKSHALLVFGLGTGLMAAGLFWLSGRQKEELEWVEPPAEWTPYSEDFVAQETPPMDGQESAPTTAQSEVGEPASPPDIPEETLLRPQQWWAITMQEQAAIERWDRSVEKEFGMLSLGEWLDAHAGDLAGVDVALLKAKLERGA